MKQRFILFFLLLFAVNAVGQILNVDSLINILETQKLSADEQLYLYEKISSIYSNFDKKKCLLYTKEGLALAEKEKNKSMMAKFNFFIGNHYKGNANYDSANIHLEKALILANEAEDKLSEGCIYLSIANLYNRQNKYAAGIEYYMKALPLFESINSLDNSIRTLTNIGNTYHALGNNKLAINYLEQAIEITKEIDDLESKQFAYISLGSFYANTEQYEKALEYQLISLDICKILNDKDYESNIYQHLAWVYQRLDDTDKAEECANESLRLAEEFGDLENTQYALHMLSRIYLEQERFKESEATAYRAWEIDSTDIRVTVTLANTICVANMKLGNIDKAMYFFEKYADICEQYNDKGFQEALIGMEIKYETEKKEMRIATLEKEKQLYIWLGIGGVLLAITLGVVLWQNIRNIKKEKQLIATQSVMDGEMKERSRMARDLHDRLSGNLSAVKIELGNLESLLNISQKLDSCIEEVRRVAHNLMPASLQYGMKTALEDFAAQFPSVNFHFFGEEKRVEERIEFVVYCCANELVNNSLKHSGAKNINLQLIQDDKHVSLTVQDDGHGYDEKTAAKGMGLKNIYDRVASCNGKIDIATSPEKGTETTIQIKIRKT